MAREFKLPMPHRSLALIDDRNRAAKARAPVVIDCKARGDTAPGQRTFSVLKRDGIIVRVGTRCRQPSKDCGNHDEGAFGRGHDVSYTGGIRKALGRVR